MKNVLVRALLGALFRKLGGCLLIWNCNHSENRNFSKILNNLKALFLNLNCYNFATNSARKFIIFLNVCCRLVISTICRAMSSSPHQRLIEVFFQVLTPGLICIFFTSCIFYNAYFRSAEIILTLAKLSGKPGSSWIAEKDAGVEQKITDARRSFSLFQHHDAITGTAKDHVVIDYGKRYDIAFFKDYNSHFTHCSCCKFSKFYKKRCWINYKKIQLTKFAAYVCFLVFKLRKSILE